MGEGRRGRKMRTRHTSLEGKIYSIKKGEKKTTNERIKEGEERDRETEKRNSMRPAPHLLHATCSSSAAYDSPKRSNSRACR
jgi:hypothetical protein